jgi:hypothetical protein
LLSCGHNLFKQTLSLLLLITLVEGKKISKKTVDPTDFDKEITPVIEKMNSVLGGVDKTVEIKIVGSIADKDEVDTIKGITEVFIIERRIRNIFEKIEQERPVIAEV